MKTKNTSLLLCSFNLLAEGNKASMSCPHRIRLVQFRLIQNSLHSQVLGMEQLELAKIFEKACCFCTHSKIRSSFVCELSSERKSWHWKSAKPLIARLLKKPRKIDQCIQILPQKHFQILGFILWSAPLAMELLWSISEILGLFLRRSQKAQC